MNIVVPVKQVPDTGINLQINETSTALKERGIKWVLNPYDEFALEEALRLKLLLGGQIFVLTLGPDRSKETLLNALLLEQTKPIIFYYKSLFLIPYRFPPFWQTK